MNATVCVNGRITDGRDAVVSVFDHGFLYGEGVYERLRTYNRRRFLFDRHARRPRSSARMIKGNNLMNGALAMQEALRQGAFEGVMRNYRGEPSECTTANLFLVRAGAVLTPPLDVGLLPGITREPVPIVTVGERPIGSGRPGPVTARLLEAYRRLAWAA